MRKIYILLVLLMLGVVGMAYLYFSNLNKEASASDNSLNIISANAPLIFTFENDKSFYEILSGQEITDNILGEEKSKLLGALRENMIKNSNINALIDGEKITIGFLAGDKNSVDFMVATQTTKAKIDLAMFTKLNVSLKKEGNFHEVKFGDSAKLYLAINQKSILFSNSLAALNKAANVDKAQKNNFANYIKQNIQVNKNTLANVYIDYAKLPVLLKNILNTNLTGELSIFNKQETYASLSYNFGSDKLLLNGYTDVQKPQNYFKLFVDQKEQKINIDQLFPEQTANYSVFAIDDYQKWNSALKALQKENKQDAQIEKQHQAISDKYRIDINQTFPQYFGKQLAVLQLKSGEKMGIIEIKNGDKLGQLLLDLSSEYAPDIRIFKEADLLANFFGEPFKRFERPFYTIIDNHFVVANYASTIQVFLNSYKNNHLLASTDSYTYFKDQTSSSATIAFYINSKNSNDIFGRNLKASFYKQYKSQKGLKDYNAFGYQLSADNGKFMSNILLLKNQTKSEIDSLKRN
ncbi:hypothetical protein [Pedobacter xixiisoli]|uniref:DUF4836 family protein n=1 Tax=Pedobacter xixiisoli TaxID=1476464 RepID=A0A286AAL3_9SPHI|nr:hypothetical protein [Pedobacter xixiisoli]SOD18956.1 hypothetical protein SAMN06297358_3273 [Pedobacter xixiisoli]